MLKLVGQISVTASKEINVAAGKIFLTYYKYFRIIAENYDKEGCICDTIKLKSMTRCGTI